MDVEQGHSPEDEADGAERVFEALREEAVTALGGRQVQRTTGAAGMAGTAADRGVRTLLGGRQ